MHTAPCITPIQYKGLIGYCTAVAGDPLGVAYLSLVGRQTAVNGIWAAFHDHERLEVNGVRIAKRITPKTASYRTLKAKLHDSGWVHWVLLYTQATVHNLANEAFFVVSEDDEVPLPLFYHQLNNAIALPIRREWQGMLWEGGKEAGLIIPASGFGLASWRVDADHDDWLAVIQWILSRGVAT